MEEQLDDLITKINDACRAMEEAELLIAGLRVEVEYWKAQALRD